MATRAAAESAPVAVSIATAPPAGLGAMAAVLTSVTSMGGPVYREIADLPLGERVSAMRDEGFRARVFAADAGQRDRSKLGGGVVRAFENMFVLGDPPNYEPDPATSIAAQARRAGRDPLDFVYDVLLADDGRSFLYLPALNYVDGRLDSVREMLVHPLTVPGLSDGGAHVGTICDGSFPTTLLTHWCRDRHGERLTVPFVVQAQCRDTARALGLLDRGVLAPGYKADINVIDFDNLRLSAPEMHFDLPAGGRRLLQRADGYLHTVVSGIPVYESGRATGELPGRLVRGAQRPPTG